MKKLTTKLNIFLVALILFVPVFANAGGLLDGFSGYGDSFYSGYGDSFSGYSGYGDSYYSGYGDSFSNYYSGYGDSYYSGYGDSFSGYSGYGDSYYSGYGDSFSNYYSGYGDSYYSGYGDSFANYSGYGDSFYSGYGDSFSGYSGYGDSFSAYSGYGDGFYYDDYSGYGDGFYTSNALYYEPVTYTSYSAYQAPSYDYYEPYYYDSYSSGYSYQPYYTGYDNNYYGNWSCGTSDCGTQVVIIDEHEDDLDVTCDVSDSTVDAGDSVTFSADVDGGYGTIRYDWSGDVNSNSRNVVTRFYNDGTYDARIRVTDARGNTATDTCRVRVEDDYRNDDFDIKCEISDTRIDEGDRVRISVDIDGGDSPFDIQWSGDDRDIDDFNDDARSQYVRIDDRGTYELRVTVEDDDGRRRTDTCPLIYVDDDYDYYDDYRYYSYSNYTTPTGNYASVGSVYLNQVPYTGPADTIKLVGFIALVLLWSFAGAYMIRKRMKKTGTSKKMQSFKEEMKAKQII